LIITMFFYQAEDGIRDKLVTGVQTCALPISGSAPPIDAPDFARQLHLLLGADVVREVREDPRAHGHALADIERRPAFPVEEVNAGRLRNGVDRRALEVRRQGRLPGDLARRHRHDLLAVLARGELQELPQRLGVERGETRRGGEHLVADAGERLDAGLDAGFGVDQRRPLGGELEAVHLQYRDLGDAIAGRMRAGGLEVDDRERRFPQHGYPSSSAELYRKCSGTWRGCEATRSSQAHSAGYFPRSKPPSAAQWV